MTNDFIKVRNLRIDLLNPIKATTRDNTITEYVQVYPRNVEIGEAENMFIVRETYLDNEIGIDMYERKNVIRYSFMTGWAND